MNNTIELFHSNLSYYNLALVIEQQIAKDN